jgi:shikimate kinase
MVRNVVLVGFMGSGKTTAGRRAAELLGAPFVDVDDAIEEMSASTVPAIFAEFGEARFREFEAATLARVLAERGRVVGTGGGASAPFRNWALIQEGNLSVYLEADLDTVLERIGDAPGRPLVGSVVGRRERLARLLEGRVSRYRQAQATIKTDGMDVEAVAQAVAQEARAAGFGDG